MEDALPSYESAIARDAWPIIAQYIPSSDLCAASLVCKRWHRLFMPFLWGDPASHFGTENDAVYVALTRFRRTLKYARLEVRMLTHTLHLPPALSEIYDGPRPSWLREILVYLPCLQSLMVSELPFFDHNAMTALKTPDKHEQSPVSSRTYNLRLLLAQREPNSTSLGLAEALLRFPELVYLDLSYTKPARDRGVLSVLSQLVNLQVLKLRGIGLRDSDAEFLANAVGIRVRFLDLRNNMLTDMAVRSLLQASFLPPEHSPAIQEAREGVSSPRNAVFGSALRSSTANFVRSPDLDERFIKLLSRPLVGRSWIEDLPHVGITHLYIADNQLTIEGVASLLASTRLHALDVGTVDTASTIPKDSAAVASPSQRDSRRFPGAEKLIPIIQTSAKDNLTYIRAHHAVVTADAPPKDPGSPDALLPELPSGRIHGEYELQREAELDATNDVHELPSEIDPVFELADTSISRPTEEPRPIEESLSQFAIQEDEQIPGPRRGSVFAPEVASSNIEDDGRNARGSDTPGHLAREDSIPISFDFSDRSPEPVDSMPQYGSSISKSDPRGRKIQELLAKRPKNKTLPQRGSGETDFPYLHPSNVPHLETLVLTDVPSHIPPNSPLLDRLIRFITACSNEALLAILQAGTDYSLPPGRSRIQAERQRARSLFALRRVVLEIMPVSTSNGPSSLTSWKQYSSQNGTSGDRDLDNMWYAAMDDFSFFDNTECGIPQNDLGKYFPMAILNEKVSLMPDDDDSTCSGATPTDPPLSASLHPTSPGSRSRPSSFISEPGVAKRGSPGPPEDVPKVDLVAELSAFRRRKKAEYEELVRQDRARREASSSLLSPLTPVSPLFPTPSMNAAAGPAPSLAMVHFIEGHWKGEVKVVRNPTPKGRTGMVDMYGNYFEKGYLYP